MSNSEHYRKILIKRREELSQRLEHFEDLLDDPKDPDVEERATEREGDEVMEIQGNFGLNEIKAIDAALTRIEKGTYGTCTICKESISVERLDAVPYAALCRKCM